MAYAGIPPGAVWNDCTGWQAIETLPKWKDAIEHLHRIGYIPKDQPDPPWSPCTCHPDEAPFPCQHLYALSDCIKASQSLFSIRDQIMLRCQICGAERKDLNSPMRWPNDIHGDPGTAAPEREEDEFGAITSRTRWLRPGPGTDYR